jgi:beta-glucosidase
VEAGDLAIIGEPIDFVGINYYHPERVRSDPSDQPLGVETLGGWETDPAALPELLARLGREYDAPPVWMTENGFPEGSIDDHARVDYLRGHLHALDERSPAAPTSATTSYGRCWTTSSGNSATRSDSGLSTSTNESQRRTPKRSAIWYRTSSRTSGVIAEMPSGSTGAGVLDCAARGPRCRRTDAKDPYS